MEADPHVLTYFGIDRRLVKHQHRFDHSYRAALGVILQARRAVDRADSQHRGRWKFKLKE